jgi:hypothetical protein
MPANIRDLVDDGQYSFQILEDGAIIQLSYLYNGKEELVSASLAYYSTGTRDDLPVGWYRIDYDPYAARNLLHSACHMHLGLFPNTRLVVNSVPTPRQFIEFVIASCYPEAYRRHRLDANGGFKDKIKMYSVNSPGFDLPQDEVWQMITHVRIPVEATVKPMRVGS